MLPLASSSYSFDVLPKNFFQDSHQSVVNLDVLANVFIENDSRDSQIFDKDASLRASLRGLHVFKCIDVPVAISWNGHLFARSSHHDTRINLPSISGALVLKAFILYKSINVTHQVCCTFWERIKYLFYIDRPPPLRISLIELEHDSFQQPIQQGDYQIFVNRKMNIAQRALNYLLLLLCVVCRVVFFIFCDITFGEVEDVNFMQENYYSYSLINPLYCSNDQRVRLILHDIHRNRFIKILLY